jgi:hypothetical protein
MTVIPFTGPGNDNKPDPNIIWVCRCGCMSFSLLADGRTECCHCNTISNDADQDGDWRKRKPPTPDEPKDMPPEGEFKVTRSGNSNAALRNVVSSAKVDDTSFVIVVQNDDVIRCWRSADFQDGDEVHRVDDRLMMARSLILPEGSPPLSLDLMRSKITNSKEVASIILIRTDGSVVTWASADTIFETNEQQAWLTRKLAAARSLLLTPDDQTLQKAP